MTTEEKEKEWGGLTLDEKLTELGFPAAPYKFNSDLEGALSEDASGRLHAALDQLLDTGGLVIEIEAMVAPFATGVIGPQPDIICRDIYNLIQAEEEEEEDEEDTKP